MEARHLLEFQLEMQELITIREGMITENKKLEMRKELGEDVLAHTEFSFNQLQRRFQELRERVVNLKETSE